MRNLFDSFDHDPVLIFKLCVLPSFHGLSHEETEFQVLDRINFQRFLGLCVSGRVSDTLTLWLFKERLGQDGVARKKSEKRALLEVS